MKHEVGILILEERTPMLMSGASKSTDPSRLNLFQDNVFFVEKNILRSDLTPPWLLRNNVSKVRSFPPIVLRPVCTHTRREISGLKSIPSLLVHFTFLSLSLFSFFPNFLHRSTTNWLAGWVKQLVSSRYFYYLVTPSFLSSSTLRSAVQIGHMLTCSSAGEEGAS